MHKRLRPRNLSLLLLIMSALATGFAAAQPDLGIAQFNAAGELLFPDNTATWVHAGSVLGGQYNEEAFDPAAPGVIGVVQMEPAAYQYFLENGQYANGSMYLLSFYNSEAKSQPQLQGFVQGDLRAREIHLIDKSRFTEGRGFFLFPSPQQRASEKVPDGSDCVACHTTEGAFDGTFVQFYPGLRAHLQTP